MEVFVSDALLLTVVVYSLSKLIIVRVVRAGMKDFVSNPFYLYTEIKNAFSMHGSQFKFINSSHNSRVLKANNDI